MSKRGQVFSGRRAVTRAVATGLLAAVALAVSAAGAAAEPGVGPQICPGAETAITGTYSSLTIKGDDFVPDGTDLTVTHGLTIAPGACLDAFTLGTVTVGGNVAVRPGAILALGCDPNWNGLGQGGAPCYESTTDDYVAGSVLASDPLTLYLTADTIGRSLTSNGGGPGVTLSPYVDFPVKDNTIDGSVRVAGWDGSWFGFIRNSVGGGVALVDIALADPDGNEIVTNSIDGSLTCKDDSPAPQYGDSGGSGNTVGGRTTGQCAQLQP